MIRSVLDIIKDDQYKPGEVLFHRSESQYLYLLVEKYKLQIGAVCVNVNNYEPDKRSVLFSSGTIIETITDHQVISQYADRIQEIKQRFNIP